MSHPTRTPQPSGLSPEQLVALELRALRNAPQGNAPTAPPARADAPADAMVLTQDMGTAIADIARQLPPSRAIGRRRPAGEDAEARLQQMIDQSKREVEAAKRAEADKLAAIGRTPEPRPDKRERAASGGSQDDPGKRAKTDQPTADATTTDPDVMDMRQEGPTTVRPTSFAHLSKPIRLPCAVLVNSNNKLMGNPFQATPGWSLRIEFDAGALAQPSIGLNFRFPKFKTGATSKPATSKPSKGQEGATSGNTEDQNTFTVAWEPGVKIGGEWMMENFRIHYAADTSDPDFQALILSPQIKELLSNVKEEQRAKLRDNLVCAIFRSNVHRSSYMEPEWALALNNDDGKAAHANLRTMYRAEQKSYGIAVWFVNKNLSLERFHNSCLKPLVTAVADHTPPFHQYLDGNGYPFIDYRLPSVATIGNEMYVQYPKTKDHTGRLVENKDLAPTYMRLPKVVRWDSLKTFLITFGVPVIRDMQFQKGIHTKLEKGWHRVFLQRMPAFDPNGTDMVPDPDFKYTFRAGIRLTRDPITGLKDAVPEEKSVVKVEFFNNNGRGEHEPVENSIWRGHVSNLGGREWLEATRTDFCVILTRPRNARKAVMSYRKSERRADEKLPLARLKVTVNLEPLIRDKEGIKRFCDEQYAPKLLDRVRLAFTSEPSRVPEEIDLTRGPANNRSDANAASYDNYVNELKLKGAINDSQEKVLMSAKKMKSSIVAVQGPPGAGKTRTLKDQVIALVKSGHKVLVVAASNTAVDADARAVWVGLSKEERKTIKCLRLETDGAERANRLAKRGYADYTGEEGEEDRLPEYYETKEAQDDTAIRNSLDSLCLQYHTREQYAQHMLGRYKDMNEAYKATQKFKALKRSNVPNGVTLDRHIWNNTYTDAQEAEKLYEEAKNRMPKEEYDRLVASGQFTVGMFNQSLKYRQSINNYVGKDGKCSKAEKTAVQDESDTMTERVLGQMDVVFATASNCGGELLTRSKSFDPTVIFLDEGGQITLASLSVPLTTFTNWEALFLFGDIQQLEPTVLSTAFNEFYDNGKQSPLALLTEQGFKPILLDTQYRMAPALSKFPRDQFYDNKGLKDADIVKQDNDVRRAVRKVSLELGVKGKNGEGSEFFFANVSHGCSRVEVNGTSLVNHANVEAIIDLIDRLILTKVVKAAMIKVLTYYQGQRRLLKQRVYEKNWSKIIKDAIEIHTVDSYQGNEAPVLIIDTVAAKDSLTWQKAQEGTNDDDAEEIGGEDFIRVGAVTAHVRNPNRLNVGLTRGQDATIVFGQASLLRGTYRRSRAKQVNAVSNLIGDAVSRNCMWNNTTEDTHPDSVQKRKDLGEQKVRKMRESQDEQDLSFIAKGRETWRQSKLKATAAVVQPRQYYRTNEGHTTRHFGNPAVITEADAYDEEQRQLQLAAEASKATEAMREEEERTLKLGVALSLDPKDTALPDTMEESPEEEQSVHEEDSPTEDFVSDEEDGDEDDERPIGEGYQGLDAGVGNDEDDD